MSERRTNNSEKKEASSVCGCGGRSCGSGPGKWMWIVLALAVAAVLIAKNTGKKGVSTSTQVGIVAHAISKTDGTQAVQALIGQGIAIPRLVDLGAAKCIPCKTMAPILEDLKKTYVGKLDVQFIDVWQNPDAGKKYGINVIPTQIFYNADGNEIFRHEGFFGKEDILAKWNELGIEIKSQGGSIGGTKPPG